MIKLYPYMQEDKGDGGSAGGAGGTTDATQTTSATSDSTTTSATTETTATAASSTTAATKQDASTTTDKGSDKTSTQGYWPADWRTKVAGEDSKLAETIGRYASPAEIAKALRAAQLRISSGELQPVLSENAKPEEIAEFRKSHGIPETPDKYDLKGAGIEVAEDDKALLEGFLKSAHATNQTPSQVNATVKAYYELQTKMTETRAENDVIAQQECEDLLRGEWGGEFKRNINLINGLLDRQTTQETKDKFMGGRLADGTPIGSSSDVLKMILGLALVDNPAGTVVPAGTTNMSQSVDDEIGKIEKTMADNRKSYDKDEKMQALYRDLLVARESLKSRAR